MAFPFLHQSTFLLYPQEINNLQLKLEPENYLIPLNINYYKFSLIMTIQISITLNIASYLFRSFSAKNVKTAELALKSSTLTIF